MIALRIPNKGDNIIKITNEKIPSWKVGTIASFTSSITGAFFVYDIPKSPFNISVSQLKYWIYKGLPNPKFFLAAVNVSAVMLTWDALK